MLRLDTVLPRENLGERLFLKIEAVDTREAHHGQVGALELRGHAIDHTQPCEMQDGTVLGQIQPIGDRGARGHDFAREDTRGRLAAYCADDLRKAGEVVELDHGPARAQVVARSLPALDHMARNETGNRAAQRCAGNTQLIAQLPLGGQCLTGIHPALDDMVQNALDRPLVGAGLGALSHGAPPRSSRQRRPSRSRRSRSPADTPSNRV